MTTSTSSPLLAIGSSGWKGIRFGSRFPFESLELHREEQQLPVPVLVDDEDEEQDDRLVKLLIELSLSLSTLPESAWDFWFSLGPPPPPPPPPSVEPVNWSFAFSTAKERGERRTSSVKWV